LAITAAAKMRDAVRVAAAFGGLRVQTRYFEIEDEAWLTENQNAAIDLVSRLGEPVNDGDGAKLWRDVDVDDVLAFLDRYKVHDYAPDNASAALAAYTRSRNGKGKIRLWNVAVIGSSTAGTERFAFGEVSVPKVIRSRRNNAGPADIKTLMSRRDAAIDLDVPKGEMLTEGRIKELRSEQATDTPLLALYPIDRVSKPLGRFEKDRCPLNARTDVIGMGLVFPRPPDGEDDEVYVAADLSRLAPKQVGEIEEDDPSLLEDEQA
jgi:hypothetical protein